MQAASEAGTGEGIDSALGPAEDMPPANTLSVRLPSSRTACS